MLRKIRKMLKHQEGFTLVELMIVVVILGILAGVGIQQYGRVQENARTQAHNANVKIITSAANMYLMINDTVPDGFGIDTLVNAGYLDARPINPFGEGEQGEGSKGSYTVKIEERKTGTGDDVVGTGFYEIEVLPAAI